jgi:hypothetical protein
MAFSKFEIKESEGAIAQFMAKNDLHLRSEKNLI